MAIEAGTTIGGFRVEGLVGKGGMASVYLAEQMRLKRPVALKVLAPALAADEQFVQRFQLEGVNAASLEHPNIVPVYEAGEQEHWVYLAMKFVDGKTLAAHLRERGTLNGDETLRVLADVGRALGYAHERGYVHRDVKPGNILLEKSGRVYLSDFGLSKAVGSRGLTGTGQWMGTLEYMAPEQAGSDFLDYRADLYALACVAYECLCGDPPYTGDTPLAIMMAHASGDVPSATAKNLSLPPGVDRIFERALAKNPNDRYESAMAFVESLAAGLEERRLGAGAEPADGLTRFGPVSAPPRARPEPVTPPEPSASPPASDPTPSPASPVSDPTPSPVARVSDPTPSPAAPVSDPAPSPASSQPSAPAPAVTTCPSCLGPLGPDDAFCGTCGSRMLHCRTCSGPVVFGDSFCQHCGTPVS